MNALVRLAKVGRIAFSYHTLTFCPQRVFVRDRVIREPHQLDPVDRALALLRITEGQQHFSRRIAVPGCELRIENPDEDGIGEVTVRAPHVFMADADSCVAQAISAFSMTTPSSPIGMPICTVSPTASRSTRIASSEHSTRLTSATRGCPSRSSFPVSRKRIVASSRTTYSRAMSV